MSTVFVTGATGFLGRHLVGALLAEGRSVRALVRRRDPELPASVVQIEGDLLRPDGLAEVMRGSDAVLHAAGKVSRDPADAEALFAVHVTGTKNILAAAREANVRRVVVASTSGTVAISDRPIEINESRPAPIDIIKKFPYYRSKLFAEIAALEATDLDVVVVCPSLLLGPGDRTGSSTEDVAEFMERRLPFRPGGGLSFVDARDAAIAMILALDKGRAGERYLVTGRNITMSDFMMELERITGVKAPRLAAPRSHTLAAVGARLDRALADRLETPPKLDEHASALAQYYWYVDASKAKSELGFAPRDPHQTLIDTVNDLRERGRVWP